MLSQKQINEIQQIIDDLREIVIFKIDDDMKRDDAKRLLNNIEILIKSNRG